MAHPTVVIDVAGLTGSLIGAAAPRIAALAGKGRMRQLRPSAAASAEPLPDAVRADDATSEAKEEEPSEQES